GGAVTYSNAVQGALLAASRGGDLELTLGQDFAIGYHHHTAEEIHLFMTESFTFRVITPEALVGYTVKKAKK
uniref:encapsulin n=1 Tax=Geoalkalibacter sp. TaxID=3041440 RepID=UPI00272E2810